MKCTINCSNVKVFHRAISFLAKVGDEIHFESFASGLCLSTVNSRKTGYASVKFEVTFFEEYEDDLGKADETYCKVSIRTILPLFRSLKQVECIQMCLYPSTCKLAFEFKCRQSISKTHSIPILDFSRLDELVVPETFSNKLVCSHQLLSTIVPNFYRATRDVAFDVKKDSFSIRNHIDNPDVDRESVRIKLSLRIDEFETFSIKENGTIVFSFPDFRAMTQFAEVTESYVRISFDDPGEPICLSCRDKGMFVANLVMATMIPDEMNEDDAGAISQQSRQSSEIVNVQKKRNKRVINTQDDNPFGFLNGNAADKRPLSDVLAKEAVVSPLIQVNPTPPPEAPKRDRRRKTTQNTDDNLFQFDKANPVNPQPPPEPMDQDIPNNSFNFLHVAPVIPIPESVRNRVSAQSDPPSVIPESEPATPSSVGSHNSQVQKDRMLSGKQSSIAPRPPLGNEEKQSEEIIFETEESEPNQDDDDDDEGSPTASRIERITYYREWRKYLLAKCFEKFDPRSVPGANEILVPNSDEEG